MARSYCVVIHGVAPDRRAAEVADRLAVRFNVPAEKIVPVLEVHGSPFKRGLDYVAAVKLRAVLEQCGCRAMVETETEAGVSAPPSVPQAAPKPAAAKPAEPKPAEPRRDEPKLAQPKPSAPAPTAAVPETAPAAAPLASIALRARAVPEKLQDRPDDLRDVAGDLLASARSRKGAVAGVLTLLVVAAASYFVFVPAAPRPQVVATATRGDIAPTPAPPARPSPPAQAKTAQMPVEPPSVKACIGLAAQPTRVLQAYDDAKKAEALRACSAAAQSAPADAEVHYLLGDVHSLNGEFSAAMKNYQRAADLGEPKGLTRIGSLHYFGAGVAKDFAQAMKWFRLAADRGDAGAMRKIGMLYVTGSGVAKDLPEAVAWFRRAAEKGDAASMTYLGNAYGSGEGVARDYRQAVKWFRLAADKGDAAAMTNIGNAYHNAEGVEQDYQEAMKWFRLAADKGDAGAMRNIGICYENGDGVARDIQQARQWYLRAEAASPGIAKDDLANLDATEHGRS